MAVEFISSCKLPTKWGEFNLFGFEDKSTGKEHLAIAYGDLDASQPSLIRIHSECLTGDALFSFRCDCGPQLEAALNNIAEAGAGVVLYLRQEGRGIGLLNKIKAYKLQEQGLDTVAANEHLGFAADQRDFSICQPMLNHLGIKQVRLMTNNPKKVKALEDVGINVLERVPLKAGHNEYNRYYLATKKSKLGHLLD